MRDSYAAQPHLLVTEDDLRVVAQKDAALVDQGERIELARSRVGQLANGVARRDLAGARPRLERAVLARVQRLLGARERRPHERVEEVVPVPLARRDLAADDVRVVHLAKVHGAAVPPWPALRGHEAHAGAMGERVIEIRRLRPTRVFYK
jgi:hypothetical protein